MNKRIVLLMLMSLFIFSVTACGGNESVMEVTDVPALDDVVVVEAETAVSERPTPTEETTVSERPTPTEETTVSERPTPTEETAVSEQPTEQPTQAPAVNPTVETSAPEEAEPVSDGNPITFQLEAWADNWFAAYLGEELIVEDSVSITTERSFNAETAVFEGSYPLTLNFILKDFKENDTGLEYIGEGKQQMGDGGFIMQLTDLNTGDVVAVSNAEWACTVIHDAPLDKSCENAANPVAGTAPCTFTDLGEPDGWMAVDYDDSSWTATTIHSASTVSPKGGYDQIRWNQNAELIWGPDLETNNTILCRVTVESP